MVIEGGKTFPLAPGKGYGSAQAAFAKTVFIFLLSLIIDCILFDVLMFLLVL